MQKMALYGITTGEANAEIELAIGGKAATEMYEGEKKFDVRVRYQLPFRKSETEIGNLMIPTSTGTKVPLKGNCRYTIKKWAGFYLSR